jgi:hypothetical protein
MKNGLIFTRSISVAALISAVLFLSASNKLMSSPATEEPPPGPVDTKLYGSTGEEKTVSPDSASKFAPLRCRSVDTLYKLSKPRNEVVQEAPAKGPKGGKGGSPNPKGGGTPVISVDYEVTSEKAMVDELSLILRTADGQDATVAIGKLEKRKGTISLKVAEARWRKGPGPGPGAKEAASGALPQNFEMYLVRNENRYGKEYIRPFKVSNSIVMGETKFETTLARDWTPLEGSIFAKPPIEPPKPGLNKGVGEDTEFAGKGVPVGQGTLRYVDPKQPLIGVDVKVWFWPVAGGREDCLGNLVPIFDRNYPDQDMTRVLAKPGYAVGAIAVKTNNFVNAIQITFMKLKEDKSGLDTNDSYTSQWLGPQQAGMKETKLGGDGRKVIGVFLNKGGVLDGLALVMDSKR